MIYILKNIIEQGEKHPNFHKVDWRTFSFNENGGEILVNNLDKNVYWLRLCGNTGFWHTYIHKQVISKLYEIL